MKSHVPIGKAFSGLAIAALFGAAAGWFAHSSSSSAGHPPSILQPAAVPEPGPTAGIHTPAPTSEPLASETTVQVRGRATRTVERVFASDSSDLVELLEAIGAMTRMSDAEIKGAWNGLSQRPPRNAFGNALAVLYLWSRMGRMGEEVEIPKGWGTENFASAIQVEQSRRNMPDILRRLNSGESLSDVERRAVFTDAMKNDPLAAIRLWTKTMKPEDYHYDAKWFGAALSSPESREAVMAEVRKWQSGKDTADVTIALARDWISRDPAAVEAWLEEPAQTEVKDAVMKEIVNVRAVADPVHAWEWSRTLPPEQRRNALATTAAQLANYRPDEGIQLLSELKEPADRAAAVPEFARTLAASDFARWEQWRDSLPESERQLANVSAFHLWAFNDVEKAVQWLNAQPVGEMKHGMIATLVDIYAERDPVTAAKWIQSIPDAGRRRDAATAALAAVGPGNLDTMRLILNAAGN